MSVSLVVGGANVCDSVFAEDVLVDVMVRRPKPDAFDV